MRRRLGFRDEEMHDLRNRALRCVLQSILRAGAARLQADRARELAAASRLSPWSRLPGSLPSGGLSTSHLRLMKK
jgi:hypothetical protein